MAKWIPLYLVTIVFGHADLFLWEIYGQPVPLKDLSIAVQLPVVEVDTNQYPPNTTTAGDYFSYYPPMQENRPGILKPTRDQSCTGQYHPYFDSLILDDDMLPEDLAGCMFDRVDLQHRQENFGGPKVYSLGKFGDAKRPLAARDLVLLVEHLPGRTIPKFAEDRSPELQARFFGLFYDMTERGLIPLDYHYRNLQESSAAHIRPVDLALVTPAELEEIRTRNPRLFNYRMLQFAQTYIEITRHPAGNNPIAAHCHRFVQTLNDKYPESHRRHQGILESVNMGK